MSAWREAVHALDDDLGHKEGRNEGLLNCAYALLRAMDPIARPSYQKCGYSYLLKADVVEHHPIACIARPETRLRVVPDTHSDEPLLVQELDHLLNVQGHASRLVENGLDVA